MKLRELAATQGGTVWAMPRGYFEAVSEVEVGEPLEAADPRAQMREHSYVTKVDRVGVVALEGVIFSRVDLGRMVRSPEGFRRDVEQAIADPELDAVVIDVRSPGGATWMLADTHEKLMRLRGQKPVIAVVESIALSAAYWLVSAADEIVVAPGAEVGSIGVWTQHVDMSAMLDAEGVKVSVIQRPNTKAELHPAIPLSDEARAHEQALVDTAYRRFVADVAKGRGVRAGEVESEFSPGRTEEARQAVSLRMADRVGTLEDTVKRLRSGARSRNTRAARRRLSIA